MKFEFRQSENSVDSKVLYEPTDSESWVPWFENTRLVALDSEYIEMEEPTFPAVAIARALSFHLGEIGILDGYDPDNVRQAREFADLTCNLDLSLKHANQDFHIVLNLYYQYRGEKEERQKIDLSDEQISNWIFERIVHDTNISFLIEMKIRHLFQLDHLSCSINGLDVEL